MTDEQIEIFEKFLKDNGFHTSRNKAGAAIISDGYGHKKSHKAIQGIWIAQKPMIDGYFPLDTDAIEEMADSIAPEQKEGSEDLPERMQMQQFMLTWGDHFEFKIKENTPVIFRSGGLYENQVQIKESAKETRINMLTEGIKPPRMEDCTSYVEYMYQEFLREFRDNALKNIQYDPKVKENGFRFCDWTSRLFSIYGIENTKLNRAMWRYMMHSIKRAAFGKRPCQTRIFYLIYSRTQGIGKSMLLAHLCDPFKHAFRNDATLSLFVDSSSIKSLAKGSYALVDFQELGMGKGAGTVNRDDLAALMKRVITMSVEKSRELYTTTDTASLMNMVFASSTNLHISDVIQDTEYRRYFTFDSKLTKEEAIARDWSEVDEFFNTTLVDAYRFLNEEEEPTLSKELWQELRDTQSTYRRRTDIITTWLREERMEILDEEDSTTTPMDRSALYKLFKKYVSNNGYPSFSSSRMQQLISTSLDILPVDKPDGKSYYFVRKVKDEK